MANETNEFREKLFGAQAMSPALREEYRKEMETMLDPPLTPRRAIPGVALLLILLAAIAALARTFFFYRGKVGALTLAAWAVLAVAFGWSAWLIVRDLWRRKHSLRSGSSIASVLTGASGILTVVALLLGMRHASDPKSMFNAFYVFVFYFACVAWSLESAVADAELKSREHLLRIECRLADLAEKMRR